MIYFTALCVQYANLYQYFYHYSSSYYNSLSSFWQAFPPNYVNYMNYGLSMIHDPYKASSICFFSPVEMQYIINQVSLKQKMEKKNAKVKKAVANYSAL